MMVHCCRKGFGPGGGSGIYCDTLSVSQYDSKVRSGLSAGSNAQRQSLNNLLFWRSDVHDAGAVWHSILVSSPQGGGDQGVVSHCTRFAQKF